jgi:hypothetical protein
MVSLGTTSAWVIVPSPARIVARGLHPHAELETEAGCLAGELGPIERHPIVGASARGLEECIGLGALDRPPAAHVAHQILADESRIGVATTTAG